MDDCIFCNIIAKQIPSEIMYEDDRVIVIKDIFPKAPVHLLVLSREHIPSITDLEARHEALLGHMILVAKDTAAKQGIAENGYKLIFNVGKHGGQVVHHIHLHLLGGKQLGE
jgi:histidine triad (HIT) family protein